MIDLQDRSRRERGGGERNREREREKFIDNQIDDLKVGKYNASSG
jgi:hypothetical protein